MATFAVEVVEIKVTPHPNADRLELANFEGYQCIIPKGKYQTGDTVVYIPEAAIVPDEIIEEMGLTGKLAGSKKNRVKAIRLRGIVSQGLIYPAKPEWKVGQDVQEELGITKYEPVIPVSLSGEVEYMAEAMHHFDVEHFKRYPNAIEVGEDVAISDKLHGSFCCMGKIGDRVFAASKGQLAKGFIFKEENTETFFDVVRATIFGWIYALISRLKFVSPNLRKKIHRMSKREGAPADNVYTRELAKHDLHKYFGEGDGMIFGEVFGQGIQDLHYGQKEPAFRAFDVRVKEGTSWKYLDYPAFKEFCSLHGIETVPVLYEGPFSTEVLKELTDGTETISGEGLHIREGVVVRPFVEKQIEFGQKRCLLKSISDDYLFRGNGTEYT